MQKIYDSLLLCVGLAAIWFGARASSDPKKSWAGIKLTTAIKENWAGATHKSHRNIAITFIIMGIIIVTGILLSWIIPQDY